MIQKEQPRYPPPICQSGSELIYEIGGTTNIFLLPHWRLKLFQIRLADKLTIHTVVPIVRMTDLGSQHECSCANRHFIPCRLSYF